jgi:hypothetical protein
MISQAPAADGKESAYLAFPFAAAAPPAAWELTGGVGGSALPRVPGAARHMQAIRHWAAFDTPEITTAWAVLEAPLVQFGTIHLPYAPFVPTLDSEPGTVYSWMLNNIWDTNFPGQQHGEMTFRYAVSSAVDVPARRLGAATAAGLTDPLVAVLVTGGNGDAGHGAKQPTAEPKARFAASDHPDVQVTSVGRTPDGRGLTLRLRSHTAEPVAATVTVPGAVSAVLSSPAGTTRHDLATQGGEIRVPVPACGAAEVIARFR